IGLPEHSCVDGVRPTSIISVSMHTGRTRPSTTCARDSDCSLAESKVTLSLKIVPWTCHACGARFAETVGGICASCRRTTCPRCLSVGLKFFKRKDQQCRVCRESDKATNSSGG